MTYYFDLKKIPAISHLSKRFLSQWPVTNLNKYVLADSGFYWMVHCVLCLNLQFITKIPHFKLNPLNFYASEIMQRSDKSLLLCIICMVNERSIAFIPCGHFGTCKICSDKITECPICRSFIKCTQKVFLS